jgi:ABC-type multidrug transport system fused ATPase/permease subunit
MVSNMSTVQIFSRLIKLVFPLTVYMICAILMGVAGFLCAIFIPVLSSMALVSLLGYQTLLSVHIIIILLFVCALLRGILRYAEQACNHYIAFKLLARIRDQVFGALRKLCPAKLEVKDKGSLISLITSDIELLEVFYAHTISPICIAFITSLVCVSIQVQFGWIYGLYSLFAYIVVGVVLPVLISKQSRQIGVEYRKEAANLNSYVLESMRGLKESMQYMDTNRRLEGLNKQTSSLAKREKKLKYFQAKTISLTNFCVVLLSLGLCLIHLYLNSSMDSMIVSSVLQISSFGPVIALANLGSTLSQTIGAGQRVISLLDETPMVEEVNNGKETDFKMVDVSSVDFAYEEEQILKDMNLSIQENEVIGIQGKSGSGKSTLLKLLMRFWDVSKGNILVDDLNIQSLNTSNLRKNEGYVTQETILFHDTIENNIRVAKENASEEEIQSACKKANIHEYIQSLPNGYKTMVEELGSSLSGGERQRIGLARMFLHDAKLVLLDEPTSNLDSLNEGVILKSIYEERKDKTIIFVSHRESTLSHCDRIIHMESERVS